MILKDGILYSEIKKIKKMMNLLTENRKFDYSCAMLHFKFPELSEIHKIIDPDDLYIENGQDFGLETEPHCTLLYGLTDEVSLDDVKGVLKEFKFDQCKAYNASLFKNHEKGYEVLKLDVKGKNLHEANKKLKEFPFVTDYPDYHPHLTIAYVKPNTGEKYCKQLKDKEYDLEPIHAKYSEPSGKRTKIKIN